MFGVELDLLDPGAQGRLQVAGRAIVQGCFQTLADGPQRPDNFAMPPIDRGARRFDLFAVETRTVAAAQAQKSRMFTSAPCPSCSARQASETPARP